MGSTAGFPRGFTAHTTLPYPSHHLNHPTGHGRGGWVSLVQCHNFGGVLEPRYIVGAESLDQ